MSAELKSRKWLWAGIGLQMGVGFSVGTLVFQIGTLITTGSFGAGFLPGMVFIAVFAGILAYLIRRTDLRVKPEYAMRRK